MKNEYLITSKDIITAHQKIFDARKNDNMAKQSASFLQKLMKIFPFFLI